MRDWKDVKKELLSEPEVKKEYDALELEYSIIAQVIRKRLEKGFTQKQLAQKAGTKQSAISRLESGNANPSVFSYGRWRQHWAQILKYHFPDW